MCVVLVCLLLEGLLVRFSCCACLLGVLVRWLAWSAACGCHAYVDDSSSKSFDFDAWPCKLMASLLLRICCVVRSASTPHCYCTFTLAYIIRARYYGHASLQF
jgi:hypothetical protein